MGKGRRVGLKDLQNDNSKKIRRRKVGLSYSYPLGVKTWNMEALGKTKTGNSKINYGKIHMSIRSNLYQTPPSERTQKEKRERAA